MSRKDSKIRELTAAHQSGDLDPHYLGYFECFNRAAYYDAHDVLEALWLAGGQGHCDHHFYKGLIQAAGAFVHLQHHRREPLHRVHGQRLAPAFRLFHLALANLAPYPDIHHRLDLPAFRAMCERYAAALRESAFTRNPLDPAAAPRVDLLPPGNIQP